MKILVITQKIILHEVNGATKRLYGFLKELKSRGHFITLITFVQDNYDNIKPPENCEYYDKIITVKYIRKLAYIRMIKALITGKPFKLEFLNTKKMKMVIEKELQLNKYDILFAQYYKMANFLESYENYPRIVDLCDAFLNIYDTELKNEKNIIKRMFINSEKHRTYNYEIKCIKNFDNCIYIAEKDRALMTNNKTKTKTSVVANGVDKKFFTDKQLNFNKNEIIYIGLMSYIGNHDAVKYFITNIYPYVKKQIPDVTFKIIGANPRKELYKLAEKDASIIITGRVDDIVEAASSADVSVAPIRVGAGIQNKILESMALGIPTVTTKLGAIGITTDESILKIAESDIEFANSICELLKNSNLREFISLNCKKFCLQNFSWVQNAAKLENIFFEVIKNKRI